jgi:hypothetical protein
VKWCGKPKQMFTIDEQQLNSMELALVGEIVRGIVRKIHEKFPESAQPVEEANLPFFVKQSVNAARAVFIEQPPDLERFTITLFQLQFVMQNENKLQQFTQIMLSEQIAESRLRFVENNLL